MVYRCFDKKSSATGLNKSDFMLHQQLANKLYKTNC